MEPVRRSKRLRVIAEQKEEPTASTHIDDVKENKPPSSRNHTKSAASRRSKESSHQKQADEASIPEPAEEGTQSSSLAMLPLGKDTPAMESTDPAKLSTPSRLRRRQSLQSPERIDCGSSVLSFESREADVQYGRRQKKEAGEAADSSDSEEILEELLSTPGSKAGAARKTRKTKPDRKRKSKEIDTDWAAKVNSYFAEIDSFDLPIGK